MSTNSKEVSSTEPTLWMPHPLQSQESRKSGSQVRTYWGPINKIIRCKFIYNSQIFFIEDWTKYFQPDGPYFICRPSDFTVFWDAGIEPRTVSSTHCHCLYPQLLSGYCSRSHLDILAFLRTHLHQCCVAGSLLSSFAENQTRPTAAPVSCLRQPAC